MRLLNYTAILFTLISCGKPNKSNGLDKERTAEEVYLMLQEYHKDIGKKGLTAEFKYLDDSPDFFGSLLDTVQHYCSIRWRLS